MPLPCNHSSAITPSFFVLLQVAFLLFCRLLLTTRLKRDCDNTVLPRSSTLHTVNAWDSLIPLAGDIFSRHIPLKRSDMFINLSES